MNKRTVFPIVLFLTAGYCVFGQAAALRDYVGIISQSFHPDAVAFLEKLKGNLERRGNSAAVRSLDAYIKGDSGTGFLYVAPDGTNYILTNYHVISQALHLSVTFEKQNGEQTKFSNLSIAAADEDRDIALLVFAGGQKPFTEGMRFYTRPVNEGDDVLSAGFPGLGTTMIWQLGRGIISNVSVRLPMNDGTGRILGPFIQHTAQVDPGNSGGPLLIQTPGVPTGYAVVGINTLSARSRQAANFSIPVQQIQSFLDASLNKKPVDDRSLLDARLNSFIAGMDASNAVYPHIATYLSNACTGENAEYAISEMLAKAPRSIQENIITIFGNSPVEGMKRAVAWLIESKIRTYTGNIGITIQSISPAENGYTVTLNINDETVSSEWVNEYGIWRIYQFGNFAAGDSAVAQSSGTTRPRTESNRLRAEPNYQIGAGFVYIVDRGPAVGAEFLYRGVEYFGVGLRTYIWNDFFQSDFVIGGYYPLKLSHVAFTPFANVGIGFQIKEEIEEESLSLFTRDFDVGLSFAAGLQFTTAAIPGLYLYAGYQFNLFFFSGIVKNISLVKNMKNDPHIIFVGLGYSF